MARLRVKRGIPSNITPRQELSLLIGDLPGVFASPKARRRAWFACRTEILKGWEGPPGTRPAAYIQYELGGPTVPRWWVHLRLLDERGLIGAEEATRCEATYGQLRPKQDDLSLKLISDISAVVEAADGTVDGEREWIIESEISEAESFASWHQKRGRGELTKLFRARVAKLKSLLEVRT